MNQLDQLVFDNRFLRELPADPETRNFQRRVSGASYSRVAPTPVTSPRLLAFSPEVADLLGLDPGALDPADVAQVFAGNRVLPGSDPTAARYGGHQFGNWADQLGDGRAISLGEVVGRDGERWELQLKGAGPTPYSRRGDGRAVLRSSVREFLCSEAMHHLGVPTTRAFTLVGTGEDVLRDMFYDGNAAYEPGAVVCRVAPTFLRFGNWEILAAHGELELLRRLTDHTITSHFPELGTPDEGAIVAWFDEVSRRTADMIAHWMRVGFVHGVMNTDNMSVLGLTIDYGPYGWLEPFDPSWTPNTTDASGRRYCYGNQPTVGLWNLARFAGALAPMLDDPEALNAGLDTYRARFAEQMMRSMGTRLGLTAAHDDDNELFDALTETMQQTEVDTCILHRSLAGVAESPGAGPDAHWQTIEPAFYGAVPPKARAAWADWLARYVARLDADPGPASARRAQMDAVNPLYVMRNYLAQEAIDLAEEGDTSGIETLLDVMRRPYEAQPGREHYAAKRPEWARHKAGCSMLSCSS